MAAAVATGCGGGSDEAPAYANVSGAVNFDGQPLDKGTITFSTGGRPPSTLDVVDGKFNGQAMVGPNTVSLSVRRKSDKAMNLPPDVLQRIRGSSGRPGTPQSDFDPSLVEVVPPEWGPTSKQSRVIKAGTTNKFEFDIKSKK